MLKGWCSIKMIRNKAYLNILEEIDQIIMQDQLLPGDRLPSERELAERLGVGRSSVREALRALELLDLIETRRGEGTFIKEVDSHRLIEVLASYFLRDGKAKQNVRETRRMIEIEAVRLACDRITKEQEEKLTSILQQADASWKNGEIPVEEDYQFHKTLVESSHNRLLLNIWQPLIEYSMDEFKKSLSREGRLENALKEHEQILQAINIKDESKAVRSLKQHLENSRF